MNNKPEIKGKLNGANSETVFSELSEVFNSPSVMFVRKGENIEKGNYIHSEDIQEIITEPPSWMLKWGILFFVGTLSLILLVSSFTQYPEIVRLPVRFQTNDSSSVIQAKETETIVKLLIRRNQPIKYGQPLLITRIGNSIKADTLFATQTGNISFSSIIEPGSLLEPGQRLFVIHPLSPVYFGIITSNESAAYKLKEGQHVSITINNLPEENDGQLKGRIVYIADEPDDRGHFITKVSLDDSKLNKNFKIRTWMKAEANIVIRNLTVFDRLYQTAFKGLKHN